LSIVESWGNKRYEKINMFTVVSNIIKKEGSLGMMMMMMMLMLIMIMMKMRLMMMKVRRKIRRTRRGTRMMTRMRLMMMRMTRMRRMRGALLLSEPTILRLGWCSLLKPYLNGR
jgi:hypothetical protein